MQKIKIAVCDTETVYCERLTEYLVSQGRENCEILMYTNPDAFWEDQRTRNCHAALMGEEFWRVYVHEGGVTRYIYLCEDKVPDEWNEFPAIYKYQSAENIMREIYGLIEEPEESRGAFLGNKEIIGVYSPHQHELQSMFTLTMARMLGEQEKVLYLNFMDCAGFADLYGESYEQDIADLLYVTRAQAASFGTRLRSMTHSIGGVDYIPPAVNPENLHEAGKEDYMNLLQLICKRTDYDVVIIDFGAMVPGFYEMLRACKVLYCPVKEGFLYRCRIHQFQECLAITDSHDMDHDIRYIQLSAEIENIQSEEQLRQQIFWGEFGDFIRQQLFGGGKIAAYG